MEKYKIIALIGEAGSGKDFLMKMLLELHDYHEIISCTSRPMREGEINGRNYYFYSDEYFMQLVEENKMMEWTSFNNWYYGTPINALSKSKVNIGVFNPAGIRSMLARDDIDLRVFYVSTSPKTRLLRQLNREEYPNVAEIIRRYGTDVEDFKNIDFPCVVVGNENFQEAVFATHDIKWIEDNSN